MRAEIREIARQVRYAVRNPNRLGVARLRGLLLRSQLDEAGSSIGVSSWRLIYRAQGGGKVRLGEGVYLSRRTEIHLESRDAVLEIGAGTYMNQDITFWCQERISVGRLCLIAWDVDIMDSNFHTLVGAQMTAPVTIEDHVWIGAGCRILPGVTIGQNAVVAAGSVVTKDVPRGSLVGGNPAKVLREKVVWNDRGPNDPQIAHLA